VSYVFLSKILFLLKQICLYLFILDKLNKKKEIKEKQIKNSKYIYIKLMKIRFLQKFI
jgi:hypothetical protein